MSEWISNLSNIELIYWILAAVGTLFLIIFMFITFVGGDFDGNTEVDMDVDGDGGFQFITVKNLIGFFTVMGWTGIAGLKSGMGSGSTIIVSIICGLIMMAAMAALFFYMSKLQDSGTLNIKNAIGTIGEVYLTIGANRSKIGKISVKVQGTLRELEALTDEEADLATGMVIKVTEVVSDEILLVEKLKK